MDHPFRLPLLVRFGDCDPAGIVYTPVFFDWFHQAMESWLGALLDTTYARLITEVRLGFPAARTQASFLRPCRLGEQLAIEVRVGRVGQASIDLHFAVTDTGGGVRAEGQTTIVLIDLRPEDRTALHPVPVPDDIRARVEAYRNRHPAPTG